MTRLVLAALLLSCAGASAAVPPFQETKWAAPRADLFALMTSSPGECVGRIAAEETYEMNVGAVAFRSPFLFGGSAARAGLSCNSCHRDGRSNPDFYFEGLSGAPGTADVTSSIFSKKREDGEFNPVAIPDLVGISDQKSFGSVSPHGSLEEFIASAVEDEFDGDAAPVLVTALAAYISRFEMQYCPPRGIGTTLSGDVRHVRRAIIAAREAVRRQDAATADFLLLSARGFLGDIDHRFAVDGLERERSELATFSSLLADIRKMLRENPAEAGVEINAASKKLDAAESDLAKSESASLYDRARLRRLLESDR